MNFLVPWGFITNANYLASNDTNEFVAKWSFSFTPQVDGFYRLSTGLIAWGNYQVISDDGYFDSHEAQVNISGGIWSGYESKGSAFFSRRDQNINEADSFAGSSAPEIMIEAKTGVRVDIETAIIASVAARGDDTFAQLDMTNGVGGLMCPGVSVVQY